jgi:hypothetical protein
MQMFPIKRSMLAAGSAVAAGVGGGVVAGSATGWDRNALAVGVGTGTAAASAIGFRGAGRIAGVAIGGSAAAVAGAQALTSRNTSPSGTQPVRDLLPDGEQFEPATVSLLRGRLRFDSEIANTGQAPLQIALDMDSETGHFGAQQVIFRSDQTKELRPLVRAGFAADEREDHQHLHFDDFVYFQFYNADEEGAATGPELAKGLKQSFFITDIVSTDGVPPENRAAANQLRARGNVDFSGIDADVVQGISVGMADVYGAGLAGQSLNVGRLKPGEYVLRQTFDPNDEIDELNERNNSRDVTIRVDAQQHMEVVGSQLVAADSYAQQDDGREIVPTVVDSMEHYFDNSGDHR